MLGSGRLATLPCLARRADTPALEHPNGKNMKTLILTLCCLFAAAAAQAQSAPTCKPTPKAQWRPPAQLEGELGRAGWKVTRIVVKNGCYQVTGRDPQKKPVDAYFNPRTFDRQGS